MHATAPIANPEVAPHGAILNPHPQQDEDAVARRLQRLGFVQRQHQPMPTSGGGDAAHWGSAGVVGDLANQRGQSTAPPAAPVVSDVPRAVLRMSRQRGLSVLKPSITGQQQTTQAAARLVVSGVPVGGSPGIASPPPPPSSTTVVQREEEEAEDENAKRLFTLSCKHTGAHVVTKYNLTLHYYIAGVDVDEEIPQQPPSPPTKGPQVGEDGALCTTNEAATESTTAAGGDDVVGEATGGGTDDKGSDADRAPAPPPLPPISSQPASATPPSKSVAASGSRLVTKKRRLIFCIAESPSGSARSLEQRQASWGILMALHKLYVVASLREFTSMFECFFVDDDDRAGKAHAAAGSPPTQQQHQQQNASSSRTVVAAAVREMTRSNAVSMLPTLFPVFDQSATVVSRGHAPPNKEGREEASSKPPADSPTATTGRPQDKEQMFFKFAKCYDGEGLVWCPVVRLRRIIVQPDDTKGVFAVQPLDVALPEDVHYVSKLPVLAELHDKFASRRQELIDAHQTTLTCWRAEKAMLVQELAWAEEAVAAMRAQSDGRMHALELELRSAHLALEAASCALSAAAAPLRPQASRRADRGRAGHLPTGSNELSPIKKTFWYGSHDAIPSGKADSSRWPPASFGTQWILGGGVAAERSVDGGTQTVFGQSTRQDGAMHIGVRPTRNDAAATTTTAQDSHGHRTPIGRALF